MSSLLLYNTSVKPPPALQASSSNFFKPRRLRTFRAQGCEGARSPIHARSRRRVQRPLYRHEENAYKRNTDSLVLRRVVVLIWGRGRGWCGVGTPRLRSNPRARPLAVNNASSTASALKHGKTHRARTSSSGTHVKRGFSYLAGAIVISVGEQEV
jgi:hypothetical protein